QQLDVPTETRLLVDAMVAQVNVLDPLFFEHVEDPLPLEQTLEYRALSESGRLKAGGTGARSFVREFDAELGSRRSRLVDYKVHAERSVADGVRGVLGLTR